MFLLLSTVIMIRYTPFLSFKLDIYIQFETQKRCMHKDMHRYISVYMSMHVRKKQMLSTTEPQTHKYT